MPIVYRIGVAVARLWCKICGCRIQGREHIPANQAVLVIANHTSYADPILLAAALPQHITFIAKEAFLRNPLTKLLYGGCLGAVFLNKEESDVSALRTAIKLMKGGHTVGIFPEGRRNYDKKISEFMPGAVFIAAKAGVPVLPVAISNSGDLGRFWRRSLVVNIGPPLLLTPPGKVSTEYLADQALLLRQNVTKLYAQNESLLNNVRVK